MAFGLRNVSEHYILYLKIKQLSRRFLLPPRGFGASGLSHKERVKTSRGDNQWTETFRIVPKKEIRDL